MSRPNFIELPTRDLAQSRAFFDKVFGMTMTGFGPTYACTMTGDVDIGLQADLAEASKAPLRMAHDFNPNLNQSNIDHRFQTLDLGLQENEGVGLDRLNGSSHRKTGLFW